MDALYSAVKRNIRTFINTQLSLQMFKNHCAQVCVAADRLAAVAVIGQQFGFVSNADLTHFDPQFEVPGQNADEIAEVDPLFREVIDNQSVAAEEPFDVDQLHLQFALGDLSQAEKTLTRILDAGAGPANLTGLEGLIEPGFGWRDPFALLLVPAFVLAAIE